MGQASSLSPILDRNPATAMTYTVDRTAEDVILPIRILADTRTPIEGLQHDTVGLSIDYMLPGDSSWTSISLVGGVVGTYSSGGFSERPGADGWYELGVPADAILAGAVTEIRVKTSGNEYRYGSISATAGGLVGSGSIEYPVTITSEGIPVDGASVWVTRDAAGTDVVQGYFTTDAFGVPTEKIMLDSGNYYFWVQKSGIKFPNPTPISV